jgi:hypothetical protein
LLPPTICSEGIIKKHPHHNPLLIIFSCFVSLCLCGSQCINKAEGIVEETLFLDYLWPNDKFRARLYVNKLQQSR